VRTVLSAQAFVLINCSSGSENDVLDQINELGENQILKAFVVCGLHDMIVHVRGESLEQIQEQIVKEIRHFPNVRATMTLLVVR